MRGIMHPYILSDIANDTTINGTLDVEKRTERGQKWIEEGLVEDNDIIPIEGVDQKVHVKLSLIKLNPATGTDWKRKHQ